MPHESAVMHHYAAISDPPDACGGLRASNEMLWTMLGESRQASSKPSSWESWEGGVEIFGLLALAMLIAFLAGARLGRD